MNKAVGLVRVSTAQQAEEGCSLALQHEKIRAYASLNDLGDCRIIAYVLSKTHCGRFPWETIASFPTSRKSH
jgi:hypothetical protein